MSFLETAQNFVSFKLLSPDGNVYLNFKFVKKRHYLRKLLYETYLCQTTHLPNQVIGKDSKRFGFIQHSHDVTKTTLTVESQNLPSVSIRRRSELVRLASDAFHRVASLRSDPVGSWPVASRGSSGSDETNNNLIGLVAVCQFLNSPLFVIRLVVGCGDRGEIIQSTVSACGLRVSGCSATRCNEISNILVTGY